MGGRLSRSGGEIRPLWSVVLHVWQVRHDGAFLNLALLIRLLCHLQIGLISSLRPRESQREANFHFKEKLQASKLDLSWKAGRIHLMSYI